jgi:hypothetical protein
VHTVSLIVSVTEALVTVVGEWTVTVVVAVSVIVSVTVHVDVASTSTTTGPVVTVNRPENVTAPPTSKLIVLSYRLSHFFQ